VLVVHRSVCTSTSTFLYLYLYFLYLLLAIVSVRALLRARVSYRLYVFGKGSERT